MPVELFSERLCLREPVPSDDEALTALNADPEVMEFIEKGGRSAQQAADFLVRIRKQWSELGFGFLVVRERGSERIIGGAGLLVRAPGGPADVGYFLERASWGKGYATELAARLLRWAFEDLGRDQVFALVAPGNFASLRVLEKLGMTFDATVDKGTLRYRVWRDGPK